MFVMLKIMFLTFQSVDNQCFLILFKMVTIGKRHLYRVNSIRRRVRQCDKFGPFSTIKRLHEGYIKALNTCEAVFIFQVTLCIFNCL